MKFFLIITQMVVGISKQICFCHPKIISLFILFFFLNSFINQNFLKYMYIKYTNKNNPNSEIQSINSSLLPINANSKARNIKASITYLLTIIFFNSCNLDSILFFKTMYKFIHVRSTIIRFFKYSIIRMIDNNFNS